MKEYNEYDLSIMPLEDIKRHFLEIRSLIIKAKKEKKDARNLEIYFCYVMKAIEDRN